MGFLTGLLVNQKKGKELLTGKDPEIITKNVVDPLKKRVASPLSSFLSGQVGEGVPRFGRVLDPLPQGGGRAAQDFLKLDTETLFNERIRDPALQTFREDLLPQVREEFAGSLSGSRRFRSEEEAANRFSRDLAETRANLELQLPGAQVDVASRIKEQNDKERIAQYQDWVKSLPQYNPTLERSLNFLSEGTSSGTTVLSALDPGKKGILGDLIAALGKAAASGG